MVRNMLYAKEYGKEMKKIYNTPVIAVIEAKASAILAGSKPSVATFGNRLSNDSWQNEHVDDGLLNTENKFSDIQDDDFGLSSR